MREREKRKKERGKLNEKEGDSITLLFLFRHGSSPSLSSRPQDEEEGAKEEEMKNMNPSNEDDIEECEKNGTKTEAKTQRKALHVQIREKSWFGKRCVKIFKLFTNTFVMTFLAEWGDRSQLATIVMAGKWLARMQNHIFLSNYDLRYKRCVRCVRRRGSWPFHMHWPCRHLWGLDS